VKLSRPNLEGIGLLVDFYGNEAGVARDYRWGWIINLERSGRIQNGESFGGKPGEIFYESSARAN